jgi:hypothetical protein
MTAARVLLPAPLFALAAALNASVGLGGGSSCLSMMTLLDGTRDARL